MAIMCIGQSAYDILVPMQDSIIENQKYRITDKVECGGGPALNASYLCSLWGAETYLVSRIGNDYYGDKLRRVLIDIGVNIDYLIKDDQISTPYSFILCNQQNGNRTLFNFPGEKSGLDFTLPDEKIDVILSDGHEPEVSIAAIKKYPDAISVVDAGTYRDSTYQVAKEVDYIVCSEDFARQYTGKAVNLENWEECKEIFAEVKKINNKKAVITLGEKGLLYEMDGELIHLDAYKVKAIDTNGAGDIFHGAFAYGIDKKLELLDILKKSSMASAISVQSMGGQISIPTLAEVEKQLDLVSKK